MDTTGKFDKRAADYALGRPAYAAKLIDSLYHNAGFKKASVIADIGSGTGIFARQLLDRGSTVICVEPNGDMRQQAQRGLTGYEKFGSVNGTADETGLAEQSVDFITAAQAFHWFKISGFKKECLRIMKPGGKVVLVWNVRDMEAPLNRESMELFAEYCPGFNGFCGGIKQDDGRIAAFFDGCYERLSFDHPLYYEKERFISRCLSSSYSLREGDTGFEAYKSGLEALFERYAEKGLLRMANRTVAYIGSAG